VVWGPPVVALEPRAMQNVAHNSSDPATTRRGSHNPSPA
jgi:hypothetical protein